MATAKKDQDDVWIPTTCYMCYNSCNILVHRVNGVVVKIEGNPKSPHNQSRICAKGNSAIMGLYNRYRLTKPMKRTNPQKGLGIDPCWQEISWEEALQTIGARLKEIRKTDPRKLVIESFDTQGFITIGKAFAVAFGTPNLSTGAAEYFCGNGLHPVSYHVHGSFFMEPDYHYAKFAILFGSGAGVPSLHKNPVGLGAQLADARQRGLKLVVVDPVCSNAASKADEWVPIRPGTDAALALSMANVLLNEEGIYDREFLARQTNAPYLIGEDGSYVRDEAGHALIWDGQSGAPVPHDAEGTMPTLEGTFQVNGVVARPAFQLIKEHVRRYTPQYAESITTVPAATIRRLAREFGRAARIGSTITLMGKEMPLRPALANYGRGAVAHKHSFLNCWAIQLLNTITGAVDVPGGQLGPGARGPGQDWVPLTGPDGLLVPAPRVSFLGIPYPPKGAARPHTADLYELFPAASYAQPLFPESVMHPDKYGLDYRVEMAIFCRTNYMMTTVDPGYISEVLKKIPFIVSFVTTMDETAEMADIVLPDAHVLERLDAMPNRIIGWIMPGIGDWYWTVRQPVVDPPPGVRHWVEVLFDLADQIGMNDELNIAHNSYLKLKEPFRLKPGVKYPYDQVVDALYKSLFGAEHGLEWFKANGVLITPRTIEEAYPRPFLTSRIPIYIEYIKRQGQQVQAITKELGLEDWDVSDYQPIPDWRPCPAYHDLGEYDLFVVNHKQPMHTFSSSAEIAWLNELTDLYPHHRAILINPATAARKGLEDGDEVLLQTPEGKKVKGKLRCFEGVHHEAVVIPGVQGHWAASRKPYLPNPGPHYNSLLTYDLKYIDMVSTAFDTCVKAKVVKVGS